MILQELGREQVKLIWAIDRREVIDNVYYVQEGRLVLKPEHGEDIHLEYDLGCACSM